MIPVGDAAALANGLAALWDEADVRGQLALSAEYGLQRNSLDAVGKAWETLYRGVLRGSRSTTSDAQQVYRRLSVHSEDGSAESDDGSVRSDQSDKTDQAQGGAS